MISKDKVIVLDIDNTICEKMTKDKSYSELNPRPEIIQKMYEYRKNGFTIILHTSRQMRTYDGNLGRINANTAKVLFKWLDQHNVPYDEILFGKPWSGYRGFYVDDRSIRPSEFLEKEYDEIMELIGSKGN